MTINNKEDANRYICSDLFFFFESIHFIKYLPKVNTFLTFLLGTFVILGMYKNFGGQNK